MLTSYKTDIMKLLLVRISGAKTRSGASRPQAAINPSSFWAQGITVGAEFKF
jgi:hypothetical protein